MTTTQVSTEVRLVKCPRCRQVLPELPDVPLYKCGGCSIVLQAKNRKLETKNSELSSQETESVASSQEDSVLAEKEAKNSNRDFTSVNKDNIKCQDEDRDRVEACKDRSVTVGLICSSEVTCPGDDSIKVKESLQDNSSLDQTRERYHSKFHDNNVESTGNSSDELACSGESILDTEVDTPEASEHVVQHKSHLRQHNRVDQLEGGEFQTVWQEGDNFIDGVQNLPEHEDEESVLPPKGIEDNYVRPENDEKSPICSADQNGDFHEGIKPAGLDSYSGIVSHENDNVSQSAEQSLEVDDGTDDFPIFRSSSTEKNMNGSASDSIMDPQSPLNESLVSFYLTSPDEHLDHIPRHPRHVNRNFGRISSIDTLGSSTTLADINSELNFKHGSTTNFQTTRSYYGYDGSESSYDGTDDQNFEHISHSSRKNKHVEYISSTEMLRKDRFRRNSVMNSEPETNYWTAGSSRRATESSYWSQGSETNREASANRMRLNKQGGVSRLPSTSRISLAGHRTVSPSNYRHSLLPPRPGFNSSEKPSYSDPDKIDLLRTVCELKDQLNRMHFPKATTNRRFPAGVMDEEFTTSHHDHLALERDIYADLNHRGGYNLQHNQAKACSGCNISRLAFSGDAARYRHQISCSCLHCSPQDWHYSAQLPSHSMHCKNGHCVVHTDHKCCNISTSSGPQHYTSSELSLLGCETKFDNQRPNEIKRLHLKEKYHTAKRHLRALAGGAPLIACYHCSELLQLPADFLLFKKRYHKLMCNSCKKVLKFSLLKGTHIAPHIPDASAPPPPSEADDYNDATSRRNLEPLSYSNSCQHVGHVSCSDYYGRSCCRSCSTEGENSVILPSFNKVEKNSYDRKTSSSSSYEPMEDRKMKSVLRESQYKNESPKKSFESVGSSSKWRKATSEIEEVEPLSNSPLHRLMGYASPSQVLEK